MKKLLLTCLFLAGFGPFVCNSPEVEEARTKMMSGEAEPALQQLDAIEEQAPEIHLGRATALLLLEKHDEAAKALDEAYRLTAQAESDIPSEERTPEHAARFAELRERIAFERGVVALHKKEWDSAQVEFARVLRADPTDEEARWNLELAWHHANPPCHAREDDHEPDDTRQDAKPYDPEKSKERMLCPTNEDWYLIETQPDAVFYVTLEGKLDTEHDEQRKVMLELYRPEEQRAFRQAEFVGGKATVGVNGVRRPGQWQVRVHGIGDAELTYSLAVELVPPCPADDEQEENDTREAAKAVEKPELPGLRACPGDPDWYSFTVPKEEARDVQVVFDPERAPLLASLYDAQGKPFGKARPGKGGLGFRVKKDDEKERSFLLEVRTKEDRENSYALRIKPPDEEGKDEQDQQQDQQDEQDQQDQEQEKKEQPEQQQPEQMSPQEMIEALDQQDKNPQLEKALGQLKALPQGMEDY